MEPKKKQRPISLAGWIFIVSASVFLSAVILTVIHHLLPENPITTTIVSNVVHPGSPGEKVLLVMGVDINYNDGKKDAFEGARTDTMMLLRISPAKKTVSLVSIPRDSKVYLSENRGIGKINSAFALGGAELAVATVEESFGIPVDNFVVVNTQGIREIVDAIGGVPVYIEKPMRYRDRTARLNINFTRGRHTLSGQQAEEFLRFRHDALGDIGRIRRQQAFLTALSQKFAQNPLMFAKIPELVSVGAKYVQTDLSVNDMVKVAWFAKDLNPRDIRVATLPGRPSGTTVSYWVIDPVNAQTVLDRLILDNPAAEQFGESRKNPVKVGIYYAKGMEDDLPLLTRSLEERNFKVVCKSRGRGMSTQIVEHSNRVTDRLTRRLAESDRRLAKARLIFAPVGTTFELNACNPLEDYTVFLGEDLARSETQS